MNEYLNVTIVMNFSLYSTFWSTYLFLQTVIVIYYNFCLFCAIRKVKNSFRCILGSLLVSNVIFSLTGIATYGFMALTQRWNAGEILCLCFKFLQSFALHFSSMLSIFVMIFHISKDIIKTRLCVVFLLYLSLICSFPQVRNLS